MTAVFVTCCDAGQLMTQGLFPVLPSYFALPVMFSSAVDVRCGLVLPLHSATIALTRYLLKESLVTWTPGWNGVNDA